MVGLNFTVNRKFNLYTNTKHKHEVRIRVMVRIRFNVRASGLSMLKIHAS